jgi:LCP family protein required for cell wall assembly
LNRINNRKNKKEKNYNQVEETKVSKKKNKERKKKKGSFFGRFIKRIIIILVLLIIIFGVLFYLKVKENGGGVQGILCTILGQSVESLNELEPINVLLLGVSEDIDTRLTDTIILCSYNPQEQTASMLSIPRDTFVGTDKNNAKGKDKINSLYTKGVEKTVSAVENITGVEIDYYVVVNTNALIEIVDIIGGVKFDVPIDMTYDDPTQDLHINLKAGMQKINGEKAEQLLRFRHNNDGTSYPAEYGDNDFGRMKTQRNFITETIKQTINIKNIINVRKITNTIFKNVETNMTKEDIFKYIPTIVDFDTDSIESMQLPGESEKCNNLWFFIYDKKETKKIIESLNPL